jgi:transcriptional regulator with XRE-family HTH domain
MIIGHHRMEKKPNTVDDRSPGAIGYRIALMRTSRGMSAEELATALGISRNRYLAYESGRSRIPLDILAGMACILKCSADALLGLDRPPALVESRFPTRILNLVARVMKLPPETRAIGLSFLRSLCSIHDPERDRTLSRGPHNEKKRNAAPSAPRAASRAKTHKKEEPDLPRPHYGEWTETEIEYLRIYYPRCEDSAIILDLLPGRTWYCIGEKARELGIERTVNDGAATIRVPMKKKVTKAKVETLLRQGLDVETIAYRLGTRPEIVRQAMWRYGL